jgi:YesN/AraC family two-component response regulator
VRRRKHINSILFDVLLTDLHMPGAGDGLTVVSAMRHSNPKAVTMVLSAFPGWRQQLVPFCSRPIRFW